jgi:hypothetical protein
MPCFLGTLSALLLACGGEASAQVALPWSSYVDPITGEICDVVNAANAELVISSVTGELIIISGDDVVLDATFVTDDLQVLFDGQPAGIIDFYTDGDGFRTLWWTTLTGYVIEVDGFTGEPLETNLRPSQVDRALCDACPLWDDPTVCEEPDDDGPLVTINLCGAGVEVALSLALTLGIASFIRRRG